MSFDVALALYGSVLVPGAFWIGAFSLLPGGALEKATLGFLAIVAIAGMVGGAFVRPNALLVLATAAPLYQFGLIYAARTTFVRYVGREPKDAALNFKDGLLPDRLYALVCILGGVFPVGAVLYPFTPGATVSAV